MSGDLTPEEKLLKLIKNGEKVDRRAESAEGPTPVNAPTPEPSAAALKPVYRYTLIRLASSVTVAAAVLFGGGLAAQFILGRPILPSPASRESSGELVSFPKIEDLPSEDFQAYKAVFDGRDLFKTMGVPAPVISTGKTFGLQDMLKNYSVSGIISGESPQAIIEDRANGQIHYVEAGEYLGSIQIVEVGSDGVLLRYGDEEARLSL